MTRPPAQRITGAPDVGLLAVVVVVAAGIVSIGEAAAVLAGSFNFCPALMRVVFILFNAISALTVVPELWAILVRLSPGLTV